jgi:hypothetical protein
MKKKKIEKSESMKGAIGDEKTGSLEDEVGN